MVDYSVEVVTGNEKGAGEMEWYLLLGVHFLGFQFAIDFDLGAAYARS